MLSLKKEKSYFFIIFISFFLFLTIAFLFISQLASADVFLQESQFLLYGNGKDKPPTGLKFDKQQIKALYFNQTPTKVRNWKNMFMIESNTIQQIITGFSLQNGWYQKKKIHYGFISRALKVAKNIQTIFVLKIIFEGKINFCQIVCTENYQNG